MAVDATTTCDAVPVVIERWSVGNAALALLAATGSATLIDTGPSLVVAALSMAWCWHRYAPTTTQRLGLANIVTAARLGAVICAILVVPHDGVVIGLITALVYVFDGVDGWLARLRGEVSPFGAQFDMETDSHVVMLVCVHLVANSGWPVWVLWIGALRYTYVLARWLISPRKPARERRSNLGRIIYSCVVLTLAFACFPAARALAQPAAALALTALTGSFTPDFLALVRPRPGR